MINSNTRFDRALVNDFSDRRSLDAPRAHRGYGDGGGDRRSIAVRGARQRNALDHPPLQILGRARPTDRKGPHCRTIGGAGFGRRLSCLDETFDPRPACPSGTARPGQVGRELLQQSAARDYPKRGLVRCSARRLCRPRPILSASRGGWADAGRHLHRCPLAASSPRVRRPRLRTRRQPVRPKSDVRRVPWTRHVRV